MNERPGKEAIQHTGAPCASRTPHLSILSPPRHQAAGSAFYPVKLYMNIEGATVEQKLQHELNLAKIQAEAEAEADVRKHEKKLQADIKLKEIEVRRQEIAAKHELDMKKLEQLESPCELTKCSVRCMLVV